MQPGAVQHPALLAAALEFLRGPQDVAYAELNAAVLAMRSTARNLVVVCGRAGPGRGPGDATLNACCGAATRS